MSIYMDGRTTNWKPQAMRMLRERGVAKAVVSFSGGNDEGGVDHVKFLDAAGVQLSEMPEHHYDSEYDQETKRWVKVELTDEQKAENELWELLSHPVYDRYGSFAGPFSVQGTVTFDVEAGTVVMDADQSREEWDSVGEEW